MAAVMAHTTIGELIEKFAKDQLDDMLRKRHQIGAMPRPASTKSHWPTGLTLPGWQTSTYPPKS